MTVSVGATITTSSYNVILDKISEILNPTVGGYGQNLRESSLATTNIVASFAHWNALYQDVNKCIKHQTGANIPDISPPALGNLITATFVNALETAAITAVANSSTVDASQLTTFSTSSFFTQVNWNSQVQHIRTYTWNSDEEANHHFNLGGSIIHTIGYSGTPSTADDTGYIEFVGHANLPYSNLSSPYDRTDWVNITNPVLISYSTATSSGIFTATVSYFRTSNAIQTTANIIPPASTTNITVDPTSLGTVYYSFDAIGANRPSLSTSRRILSATTLNPFNFQAGKYSSPQILTINNLGPEPITISNIVPSNNGVVGFVVSTATNLTNQYPVFEYLNFPLTIASNDDLQVVVVYREPTKAAGEIGTFYNSIVILSNADTPRYVVDTVQNVTAPSFDFNLYLSDTSTTAETYDYVDWQAEYGLSDANRLLGINIANTYYLSNTDFGVINGIRRYGLFRKPDADNLKFWVDYTNSQAGGNFNAIAAAFFASVDAAGVDIDRSRSPNKPFDEGYGYGDFYDKTVIDTNVSGGPRTYSYIIEPFFGSISAVAPFNPGYTVALSNQEYNTSPSQDAVDAFSVVRPFTGGGSGRISGPQITFTPILVSNIGTYSTDVTVTVTAVDLTGATVNVTKTVNLSLTVSALTDGNLVKWVSGYEENNAVLGISYDRINGQLYLTFGIGTGADGGLSLDVNGYNSPYVQIDRLNSLGDEKYFQYNLGYKRPLYKTNNFGAWGPFLNGFGVWHNNTPLPRTTGNDLPVNQSARLLYQFTAASSGSYRVEASFDNTGQVYVDDVLILNQTDPNGYVTNLSTLVSLTQGVHKLEIRPINAGGDGAFAVVVRNPGNSVIWSTLDYVRSTAPYLYWREVYRIPIESNVAKRYYPGRYIEKESYPVLSQGLGYQRYGNYFGFQLTNEYGSIMTIDSDGKGNLTFNWQKPSLTAPDSIFGGSDAGIPVNQSDRNTIINIENLPYYASFLSSRKFNLETPAATTRKLVGVTTRGVRTTIVDTPGISKGTESVSTFIAGVPSGGRGPSIVPGSLQNIFSGESTGRTGYFGVVSKHYVSDEGGAAYAASRSLTWRSPNSQITPGRMSTWGFDPADGLIGRNIRLTRITANVDQYITFRYGIMEFGMSNFTQGFPVDSFYGDEFGSYQILGNYLTEMFHVPAGRGFLEINGNFVIPDPTPTQLIYLIVTDATRRARGFDNMTLYFTYDKL